MNGRRLVWRRAKRERRAGRWSVRRQLAEARIRREVAWLHGR